MPDWITKINELKDLNVPVGQAVCPLGLPIGGKTPKEIGISLAAQILSIYHETTP